MCLWPEAFVTCVFASSVMLSSCWKTNLRSSPKRSCTSCKTHAHAKDHQAVKSGASLLASLLKSMCPGKSWMKVWLSRLKLEDNLKALLKGLCGFSPPGARHLASHKRARCSAPRLLFSFFYIFSNVDENFFRVECFCFVSFGQTWIHGRI